MLENLKNFKIKMKTLKYEIKKEYLNLIEKMKIKIGRNIISDNQKHILLQTLQQITMVIFQSKETNKVSSTKWSKRSKVSTF